MLVLRTTPAKWVVVVKIRMVVRAMIVEFGLPREAQLALGALMDRHGQLRLVLQNRTPKPSVEVLADRLLFGMVNSIVEWYRPQRSDGAAIADAVTTIVFSEISTAS